MRPAVLTGEPRHFSPQYFYQILQQGPKASPGHPRHRYLEHLPRRHLDQKPELPQLAPLNAEGQRLYLEPLMAS